MLPLMTVSLKINFLYFFNERLCCNLDNLKQKEKENVIKCDHSNEKKKCIKKKNQKQMVSKETKKKPIFWECFCVCVW